MMNFVLGAVAGGLIACVATITAARNPEVQQRLGLVPTLLATPMAATPPAVPDCPPTAAPTPSVGTQEMLFNRRRFWSVAP